MKKDYYRGQTDDGIWFYGDLKKSAGFCWINDKLVDPNTVGQSTGLKDINGKEIFEDDIIDFVKDGELCDTPCFVRWHKYLTMFYTPFSYEDKPKEDDTKASLGEMIYQHGYQVKVLGNIYDNTKLIPTYSPFFTMK